MRFNPNVFVLNFSIYLNSSLCRFNAGLRLRMELLVLKEVVGLESQRKLIYEFQGHKVPQTLDCRQFLPKGVQV